MRLNVNRRERPQCRKQIELAIADGFHLVLQPRDGIGRDGGKRYDWDGHTLCFPNDVYKDNAGLYDIYRFSEGMRQQLHLMIADGRFGDVRIVKPKRYRDEYQHLVDTYDLDTLRHAASDHKYPFGRCAACSGVVYAGKAG